MEAWTVVPQNSTGGIRGSMGGEERQRGRQEDQQRDAVEDPFGDNGGQGHRDARFFFFADVDRADELADPQRKDAVESEADHGGAKQTGAGQIVMRPKEKPPAHRAQIHAQVKEKQSGEEPEPVERTQGVHHIAEIDLAGDHGESPCRDDDAGDEDEFLFSRHSDASGGAEPGG